jgi:diguanylate cyclase (GGDEF)-like protein
MDLSIVAATVAGLAGGAVLVAVVAAMILRRSAGRSRELRHALAVARYDAEHDALTGLANRTAFIRRAVQILADGPPGRRLAVAVVDVDDLKQINDGLGHGTGDLVLRVLASRMQGAAGTDGLVARLGGDEFAAIVALVDGQAAHDFGRALHAACVAPVGLDRVVVHVSVSVGVVPTYGPDDLAVLLGRADRAMYRAKFGRLGAAVSDPALDGSTTPLPANPPTPTWDPPEDRAAPALGGHQGGGYRKVHRR